jgi:hypothetical protein
MSWQAALDLAQAVQDTTLGTAISESPLAFPIIEGLHLIGLSLSVGLLFLIDLRLLGWLFKEVPVADVLGQLRRFVLAGFVLVFVTGILLFFAEAPALVASPAFPFKVLFIVLAGLNAWYFERVVVPRTVLDQVSEPLPAEVRRAGWLSLGLWTLVIVCGRLIPYLPEWS